VPQIFVCQFAEKQTRNIHLNVSYPMPYRRSIKNRKYWFESKRSPKLSGEMIPYKKNSFIVKWQDRSMNADASVMYRLNKYGKATSMKMKPISPLTDFSYDFKDLDFKRLP
jgi:hypothetical protein